MGGAEFKDWLTETGLSRRRAAEVLGLSKRTVIRYAGGKTQVPYVVELACKAVKERLDQMAYSKDVNMHKRRAMGETITGMKDGGAAKVAVRKHEKNMHPGKKMTPMKKGGKACS